MPVIVKAKKNQSTNDVIRQFRKQTATADIVQIVKDRRYFKKPSQVRAEKTIEMNRLRKRARSLKRMKNISPQVLSRINERLGS
ncbi:MAG: 30S ribosomal protein S21 [Patescibacteria group bacterium]